MVKKSDTKRKLIQLYSALLYNAHIRGFAEGKIFTGNTKAAELYRRMGFVNEGVARNACAKDGIYYDLNLMSMLRDEYFRIYG